MKRRLALLVLLLGLWAAPAFAQGCAMCYTGAEASGQKAQKALRRGVAMLMLTTLGLMVGLAGMAYRFRNGSEDQ